MEKYDQVLKTVYFAIDKFNESMSGKSKLTKTPSTILLGKKSSIDSLQLLNLLMEIEKDIESDFGLNISFLDKEIWDHLDNVGVLINYISEKIG